ncbi:hypothetical protein OS187_09065 [Xanthomonadaceae bacterium JHOS43]|nr:hypothetical protein [Xanthomonadaceae bacterium JHOS43]
MTRFLMACAVWVLSSTLSSAWAQSPQLRLQTFTGSILVPAPGFPPAPSDQPVRVWLRTNNAVTLNPPITVTSALPEGVRLDSYTVAAGQESDWSCTTVGQALTCAYSKPLVYQADAAEVNLLFRVNDDFVPPLDGTVPLRFHAGNAQVPVNPAPATCSGNSVTTCSSNFVWVNRPVIVLNSFTHGASPAPNTQNNAPMRPAGFGLVRLQYDCGNRVGTIGCDTGGYTPPADIYVRLPPGLHWRLNPIFPLPFGVTCDKLVTGPDGELVRCSQALSGMMLATLYVDVSPDIAAPSTVIVDAIFDDVYQPAPSSCAASPMHPNCASHPIDIIAPAAGTPLLVFEGNPRVWAGPETLAPGQTTTLTMRFANRGTGAANQSTLQLRLPAGLEYLGVAGGSAMSCTASGSVAAGQTLVCLRPVVIPAHSPSFLESLNVRFSGGVEVPAEVPVLFEISPEPGGNASRLNVCAASPGLGQCAILMLDLVGYCANHGIDGIFCDGFESSPGQPFLGDES